MDTPHAVVTHGLSKSFRTGLLGRRIVKAVSGLSMEIESGHVTALLGPNGSGKTTLLRILVGLVRPTSGSVSVLGFAPGRPEALSRIGFLPETPGLLPNLTATENVALAARMRGMPSVARRQRTAELLDRFGLLGEADRRVNRFSTGMLKRVGLCQALVHDPDLLLLDEPASGLDPASSTMLEGILRERSAQGRTVLVSSHLLWRVEAVADRVCVMNRGSLAAAGSLAEVAGIPGSFEIRASGGSQEEAREALVRAGFDVEYCRPARFALEDVFLKLTRGAEGGGEAG